MRIGPSGLGNGDVAYGVQIGLDGVHSPLVFPGSTDTNVFRTYVDQMLVPELRPGDVVVFDNLKPHLAAGIEESISAKRAEVLRLPPYSPDYSPTEEMLSKVKQLLRRCAARTRGRLYQVIGEALRQVTPEDILGWFQHSESCAARLQTAVAALFQSVSRPLVRGNPANPPIPWTRLDKIEWTSGPRAT